MFQRYQIAGVLAALTLAPAAGGSAGPKRFELRIPGEGSAFAGKTVALKDPENVNRLVIEILNPTAEEIVSDTK